MKKEIYILAIFIICSLFLGEERGIFNFNNKVFATGGATVQATIKITVCGNSIKESGEECDGYDLGGTSCTNLGYSGGTLGCSAACERQTSSCISTTPQASTTPTIYSSSGGEVSLINSDNTASVFNFPQNFYTEDLKLQANSYANNFFVSNKPAPSGKNFIGKTYDFSFTTLSETQTVAVSVPVNIMISYLDSDVSGLDESTLVPYRWGPSDTSWQLISGAIVDTTNNKVTFSTTNFSSFALFGSPAQQQQTGGGSSGGGGGGGSATTPVVTNTKVILQGKASPAAYLTALKDGQVIANTQANSQADFKIEVANLVAGIYTFGIWGEDNSGTRSITFSFTVNVASGTTTTVSNIFLPPTIALDKDSVKKGETIGILGQTVPQAQVEIHVSSTNIIEKVVASNLGSWFYNLDTSRLEEGVHSTRAKVSTADGLLSTFSQTKLFGVGVPISIEAATQTSDLNNDQKINLIDFSIILYNWGTPKNSATDLNNDGKVDLIDFSIMLYYWTG